MDPITAFLVNLLIGVVLSVASTLAQQAFGGNKDSARGFRGTAQAGGKVPKSFLVGTIGVPGKREYRNTWGEANGTPNAYLVDVLSFGDLPISGFIGLSVNSQAVTLPTTGLVTQGYPVPEYLKDGKDHLWRAFFDGTQTTANSYLTGKFGTDPDRPWTSDMIGRGIPYLTLTARVEETLWSGFPDYMPVFQGIRLYDIRKDSTKGGSGTQRWAGIVPTPAEQATWAFSDNNLVITYNILRGIYYDGEKVWGGDAGAYQLPYAGWAAAMDACDETVTLDGGGTEKRFRAGRQIFFNERPSDVVKELLIGANARICPSAAGIYYVLVGVPSVADGSFTDADVLASEATTLAPFPNLDGVVNGATATYLEPMQAWESKETAPYYRSDLEAEDDGRRQIEGLSLDTTFSGTQAQRILKAVVEESRRFARHVVPLPPAFGQYRVLQALAWTSTENGYPAKLFLITAKTEDPFGNVVLGLQEIDPADHDWTPATDESPLSFAPMTPIAPASQPMTGWTASPAYLEDSTGAPRRPSIEITAASGLDDVRNVWVQVRVKATGAVVFDSDSTPYASPYSWVLNGSFLANTLYQARGKYVPFSGRATDWSGWIDVLTPNVLLGMADISPGSIDLTALNASINDAFARLGVLLGNAEVVASVANQIQGVRDRLAELADVVTSDAAVVERNRRRLSATLGEAKASITNEQLVRASEDEALATEITLIEADVGDNAAAIAQEATARANADGALTTQITAAQSTADDAVADIATEATTRANADGALTTLVNTAQSTANNANAAISSEATTRANADAAITTLANTAQSTANSAVATGSSNTAAISSEATTRANADSALTTSVNTAQSTANNANAAVASEATTRANADGALSASISGVQASYDSISASGLIQMDAIAAPAGVSVRISILARKTIGDSFVDTGFVIDIFPDNSTRIAIKTDKLVITDGTDVRTPFTYSGGVLYLDQIEVNGAKITNLTVANEKYQNGSQSHTAAVNTASDVEIPGGGTDVEVLEVLSEARGGSSVVWLSGAVFANSADPNKFGCVKVGVYKGDVLVKSVEGFVDDNYYDQLNFSLVWKDTSPGTGNVPYQAKVTRQGSVYGRLGGNGTGSLHATQCTLVATNYSKG